MVGCVVTSRYRWRGGRDRALCSFTHPLSRMLYAVYFLFFWYCILVIELSSIFYDMDFRLIVCWHWCSKGARHVWVFFCVCWVLLTFSCRYLGWAWPGFMTMRTCGFLFFVMGFKTFSCRYLGLALHCAILFQLSCRYLGFLCLLQILGLGWASSSHSLADTWASRELKQNSTMRGHKPLPLERWSRPRALQLHTPSF